MKSQLERDEEAGRVRYDPESDRWVTTSSWTFVDLEPAKRVDRPKLEPVYLRRTDGAALIYPGRAHAFVGESETLKSWAALATCKSVFELGGRALYIDFEDEEDTFVDRARVARIPDDALGGSIRYMRPDETLLTSNATTDLQLAMADFHPSLVVLDGVTECYALHGWDINSATDAARWQHLVRDAVRAEGAASVEIDHTGKDLSRGAVGSQHKRAGINGAQFEFRAGKAPDVDHPGWAYVHITKDRHGQVRRHTAEGEDEIGVLNVDSYYGVFLSPPENAEDRNDRLDAEILAFLVDHPSTATGPLAVGISRRKADVQKRLDAMEKTRTVRLTISGTAHRWTVPEPGEQ
jgi:AAA domain